MSRLRIVSLLMCTAAFASCACTAPAQQTFYDRFRAHNAQMASVQPTWMGPLIQPDSRLTQSARLSLSNSYTAAGTRTVSYGNYHTLGLIAGNRIQVNLMAPPYVENNSAGVKDGFGDAMVEMKYRMASGNADHGNFALTPMLCYSLPTGSHQNGAATGVYYPTLAAGKMWGRFDVQSTLGGTLPAGKIAEQGRSIEWNTTAQVLARARLWIDVEDNAIFNYGGTIDGRIENFVTPAVFYVVRRKEWKPTHPVFVVDAGMQIATTAFHTYNHDLIAEMRILF